MCGPNECTSKAYSRLRICRINVVEAQLRYNGEGRKDCAYSSKSVYSGGGEKKGAWRRGKEFTFFSHAGMNFCANRSNLGSCVEGEVALVAGVEAVEDRDLAFEKEGVIRDMSMGGGKIASEMR